MKEGTIIYKDGTLSKSKNRRLMIQHFDEGVNIEFVRARMDEMEDLNNGAVCASEVVRNRALITRLKISHKAMEQLIHDYIVFKEENEPKVFIHDGNYRGEPLGDEKTPLHGNFKSKPTVKQKTKPKPHPKPNN